MFVVNVCKLNKTNDVGALRLIVCSKYQEDKRQVLTPNHQVAGWNMNNVLFAENGKTFRKNLDFHGLKDVFLSISYSKNANRKYRSVYFDG